jgi:predicted DsbA family dithiol-disulfide isomerase
MAGTRRRDLVRIAALIGILGLVTARPWRRLVEPDLAFEAIPDLPPLRRLVSRAPRAGGPSGRAVLLGLEPPGAPSPAASPIDPAGTCTALHLPWDADAPIPVSYFTDIACPVCRGLDRDLAALARSHPALFRLHMREFPVFGPGSEAAARAIRAADGQGGAETVRTHLLARPAPTTPEALRSMAIELGLDPEGLLQAWSAPQVIRSLARDRALAGRLGFLGTPGLVIGRTVVPGALPRDTLERLMMTEAEEGPPTTCA